MGPVRRTLFQLAWWLAWSLEAAGRAVAHVAAGALTRAELRAAIARTWEHYGADAAFIASGLHPWERELYDRVLRPDDSILLVGCGTGRDLIALLRRGHLVEGLEPARRPLELAREALDKFGLHAPLHQAAIESAELLGRYDVVVFSAYSYCYIPESRSRVAVLAKVKSALAPGGRIIVPYLPRGQRRTLPIRLTGLVAQLTRSDWRPEPGDKIWVSLADELSVEFDHEFDPRELEAEARAAGLQIVVHGQQGPLAEGVCVLTV
jgi:SAM-dependent methyltransferase